MVLTSRCSCYLQIWSILLWLQLSEVLTEKYSKMTLSGRQHFYAYFQNPSENSATPYRQVKPYRSTEYISKPEGHWSCIAHLSAEDILKSAVTEEKKFKHTPWAGADNPLGPKFLCQREGLITMVIYCKFKKNLFNLWLYTHLFMI